MLINYFKTAWRGLIRGKSFSIINISGLAVGMAGAMLILLWLQYEIGFDEFHKNKDRIYEVYGLTSNTDGKPLTIPAVSQPLGPAMKANLPEVEGMSREKSINSFLITANEKSFTGIQGSFVDPGFLNIFSFPLSTGNREQQLRNANSIVLTEKLANKLFGSTDVIGKLVKIDTIDQLTITGILKDLPSNTRFDFEYLLSWDYLKKLGAGYSNESWLSNNVSTFVMLKPNTNLDAFNAKIKDFTKKNTGRADIWTHFLFPLHQWHLYSEFENGVPVSGRIETVRVFAVIAAFILLIACINFMNLSTARSEKRAKEVGIRKVAGAPRHQLVTQFISEALLTAGVSGLLALIMVRLVLPYFDQLVNAHLELPYQNIYFWISACLFIVITGILAGSYPAFYLSSFKPTGIFRKQFRKVNSIITPRKVLVVLQFSFAIILIIATIVIRDQVRFSQDRKTGYEKENLVQVNFVGEIEKNYELIKHELVQGGIAESVTKTMTGITEGGGRAWGFRWPNETPRDTNTTIWVYSADAGLVRTMGLKLVDGRDIDATKFPADSFSLLVNEAAVKTMGFKNPVGQILTNNGGREHWQIVGVVKDFVTRSPYDEVPPTVIMGPGAWFNTMHIKFNPSRKIADNLAGASDIFKKYNPSYPFDYKFVDQEYARKFESAQRTKLMAALFAGLAIFISCLGLFGLSAFVAESRVKEIGVRKVLGASAFNVTRLLSFDFIKPVAVSILIAIPVAWWAMNKWLEDYPVHIQLNWELFLAAGLAAIAIALATVSYQSIRASMANPVKSLRME